MLNMENQGQNSLRITLKNTLKVALKVTHSIKGI
jgi:hypothetical protein